MSFELGDGASVFAAMRPRKGQVLTRAVVATYSLDMVALLGLVLALGGDDEADFASSPLGLVKAFEQVRGKLVVMHQLGRISAPRGHRSILPLLDTMLHAVATDERMASWHPKIMLARYASDGGHEWRFWIGSRNLTGSTDLEAGLLLVSGTGRGTRPIADVHDLTAELLAGSLQEGELTELRAAKWSAPAGVTVRRLLWRRRGEMKSFLDEWENRRPERIRALSPFIDRTGVGAILGMIRGPMTLMTTREAMSSCGPLGRVEYRTAAAPDPEAEVRVEDQQQEAAGDFSDRPTIGVHAKLLMTTRGQKAEMMLGSANLTSRGLRGPNAEAVALLDISDPAVSGPLASFIDQGVQLSAEQPDEERQTRLRIERELDHAIYALLDRPMALHLDGAGLRLSIDGGIDDLLATATVSAASFGASERQVPWPPGAAEVVLLGRPPPLEEQSSLVILMASSVSDPSVQRSWVQQVELPGLDKERRDRALLARYVGITRFRAWLRALLDGYDATGGERWTDDAADRRKGTSLPISQFEHFALENMLASWARDPLRFEARLKGVTAMLDAFEETFGALPEADERSAALRELGEVRPFIAAVTLAIGQEAV